MRSLTTGHGCLKLLGFWSRETASSLRHRQQTGLRSDCHSLLPLGLGTFLRPFSDADGKSTLVPTMAAPRPRTCSRRHTPP
jgi:hypothetical protein